MQSQRDFVRVIIMLVLVLGITAHSFGESKTIPSAPEPAGLPADVPLKNENKPAPPPALPKQNLEPAVPRTVASPPAKNQVPEPRNTMSPAVVSHKANIENFRTYRGEKSPAIFTALINRDISPSIHQEPLVALSDGKTTLKITVRLRPGDGDSPNFALTNAMLSSLKKDPASSSGWIIEALPRTNTSKAGLTILTSSELIEYPLNLAPPVAGVSAAETDFIAFLKDSGASPPKRDLNGDGKHDYQDDFIYTANYLVRKNTGGPKSK